MILLRVKTVTLVFLSFITIVLTACGTDGNSALGATGEGNIDNIAPVSIPIVDPDSISRGKPFKLDGSQSYDEDGKIVSYKWVRDFGKFPFFIADTSVVDVDTKKSLLYPPGTHTFGLWVTDNEDSADYYTTDLTVFSVLDPDPNLDYLEIQEGNDTSCSGKIISNTTQTITLVENVRYDPLSPNAYHPTLCAVWKDGSKTYVNDKAAWSSSQPWPAFVFSPKGSYVFGRDLTLSDPAIITAFYEKTTVSFKVNVELGADDDVLESIELRTQCTQVGEIVTELEMIEGGKEQLIACGKFIGSPIMKNINSNVYYESDNPEIARSFVINGIIRGISAGSTTITVGWQGKTTTVDVTVTK